MTRTITAIGLALALAACKQQPANVAADETANLTGNDAAVANAGDGSVAEEESAPAPAAESAAPVQVVAVPAPAASVPATDATPLQDAAAVAVAIDRGGYDRVRSGDGWAWRHNGQIVRTASLDGRRVAYYRPGAADPYLVQDDGHAYEYRNGRVRQAFDDHGHPMKPDAAQQRQAEQDAHDARGRHDAAPPAPHGSAAAPHAPDRSGGHDRASPAAPDHGRASAPPPADPGPQGNRITEHKGGQDRDHDRDGKSTSRDDQDNGRGDTHDHPHP